MRFIASLSSVTTLDASAKMLPRLTKVRGDAPLPFPALRTVQLTRPNMGKPMLFDDVKSFLEWRINRGYPIHELHLLYDRWVRKSSEREENFEFLERLSNFKLTMRFWSKCEEYVCGKGPTEEYGTGKRHSHHASLTYLIFLSASRVVVEANH